MSNVVKLADYRKARKAAGGARKGAPEVYPGSRASRQRSEGGSWLAFCASIILWGSLVGTLIALLN